ncbi:hypothetical protein D3C80_1995830 [compost metagenome]|jgi:uncharacterized membrane protein YgcG
MLKFLGICLLIYVVYRLLKWAFRSGRQSARRNRGDGFFDFDGFDGGGDSGGGGD